jgi:hypothetical protein
MRVEFNIIPIIYFVLFVYRFDTNIFMQSQVLFPLALTNWLAPMAGVFAKTILVLYTDHKTY